MCVMVETIVLVPRHPGGIKFLNLKFKLFVARTPHKIFGSFAFFRVVIRFVEKHQDEL